MSASIAVPEEQKVIELAPLACEHATDCDAQVVDGRLYITWTDRRPEGWVAVSKNVIPADMMDRVIDRLLMARAERDASRRSRRGN